MLGPALLFLVAAALIVAWGTLGLIRVLLRPRRLTYGAALGAGLPTDPADLGLVAAERTFQLSDKSHSPGWVIQGQDPAGPAIVITHGFGDGRYGALAYGSMLVRFCSLLVVYDLRGHGDSTAPRCHQGTTEVADLRAILRQLQPDIAARPLVLAGYSMGAGISIAAAATCTDTPIAGVIAEAPYRQPRQPIAGFLRQRRWPVFPFVPLALAHLAFWHQGWKAARQFDRLPLARRLTCPLLVLQGDADPICPAGAARQIAEAAPQGRYVEFPGGGHLDLAQRDPERYLNEIREFLRQLPRWDRSAQSDKL